MGAGNAGAYNSINIGYILGEIVRRVTGKTVGTFLREEVAGKLGADYHIGMRPDEIARVSDMHPNPKNTFFEIADDPRRRSAARSAPHRSSATSRIAARSASSRWRHSAATVTRAHGAHLRDAGRQRRDRRRAPPEPKQPSSAQASSSGRTTAS